MKTTSALLFSFFLSCTLPASAQDTAVQPPAKEVVYDTIEIPHSARTKDNFADIALDLVLSGLFSQFDNVTVSYGFLETSFRNSYVTLSNFVVKSNKPTAKGTVSIGTLHIGLQDLLRFLRKQSIFVAGVEMKNLKIDMALYDAPPASEEVGQNTPETKEVDRIKAAAELVDVKEFTFYTQKPGQAEQRKNDLSFKNVIVKNARMQIVQAKENYRVSSGSVENLLIHTAPPYGVVLTSAEVDGKKFNSYEELRNSLKK